MRNKAQTWSIDLAIGIVIFLILMVIYFTFANNLNKESRFDKLYDDAIIVSDTLLSTGGFFNASNNSISLTDGKYRLNSTKFANISTMDYYKLKLQLKTQYDYLIFFENKTNELLTVGGVQYIGKPSITKDNVMTAEKPSSLVSIKRFVILENEVIAMVTYLWD